MAESNQSVAIVAVIAIVLMLGLVIYFVMQESESDIEIDLGAVPALVIDRTA